MNGARFDVLARVVAPGSRRRVLAGIGAGGLAAVFASGGSPAASKKKRCRRCPAGLQRLANGSCAKPCAGDGDCLRGCACFEPNSDTGDARLCVVGSTAGCASPACASTAELPRGEICAVTCSQGQLGRVTLCSG